MTKKIFAMFLALLMVVSVLPTSVFAANEHPAADKHTASNCDCVVVRVTEPTCGSNGYTTYKCKDCGVVFADNFVSATGTHSWVEGEGKAPTCGAAGYEAGLECEDCGEVKPGATIDPIYKAGTQCEFVTVTSNVSCLTGGTIKQECVACGATKSVKVEKSESGEHTWNYEEMTVKVEPTATEAGIVVVTCSKCYMVEEIEWYPVHLCTESLMLHKRVEATCTSNGNIEHYECRVCGKLYGNADATDRLRDNEYADEVAAKVGYAGHGIILLGGHTKPASFVASCDDQTVTCAVASCKAKFVVKGAHDLPADPTSKIDPTCTTKGYTTYICQRENCKMPVVKEKAAKGHVEIVVTVPSTCHTYGYTFTACMREECNKVITENVSADGKTWYDAKNGSVAYDISLEYMLADRLVANDVAYNLSFTVEKDHVYAGAFDSAYALFWGDVEADATNFYLEAYKNYKKETVAGAYRLYSKSGSAKTYYVINSDLELTTVSSVAAGDEMFWTMNEELGTLTYKITVGSREYEMFLAAGEVAADTYAVLALPVQYMPYVTAGYYYLVQLSFPVLSTRLVNIEVDFDGKFNENNHDWAEIRIDATCATDGSLTTYCKNGCAVGKTETLAKGEHQWAKTTDVATIVAGGFLVSSANVEKANDCDTAGFHYELCSTCGTVRHVVDAAEGHYWDTINARYQYANHKQNGYWYYACEYCDEQYIISAVTPWALENVVFETKAAANAAHENLLAATGTVVSGGSCSVAGKQLFLCTGCNKYVAVKTELTAKDGDTVLGTYVSGNHFVKAGQIAVDGPLAGTELTAANYYKAPTCEEAGYIYSFVCGVCGETIGNAAAGKQVVLKKAAHNFAPVVNAQGIVTNEISALEAYLNPCPNAIPYKCTECNEFCTSLDSSATADCENPAFDLYICSCGEKHLRGMFGYFGHEWVNPVNSTPSKHSEAVITTYTCAYCDKTKQVKNPIVHVNADGDKFTDLCNDTETDRHCIKCCQEVTECYTKGEAHNCTVKQPGTNKVCNCVIKKNHRWETNNKMNSSCTMPAYEVKICKDCEAQSVTPATEYSFKIEELSPVMDGSKITHYVLKAATLADLQQKTVASNKVVAGANNAADADGKIITSMANPNRPLNFVGHKPAEVDYELNADGTKKLKDGQPIEIRYANYTYIENYEYTWYEYVKVLVPVVSSSAVDAQMGIYSYEYKDGEAQIVTVLIQHTEVYTAKFEKYVAPTFAADGVLETECQECNGKVTQVLPKQTGLGFEMSIANANGQSGLAFGSLIEVTVSVNALKADIYGFQFNVTNSMGKDMIYVGYETVNENFNITVTNPEEVAQKGKDLIVSGFANNNADGKVQNIEITEKTALVKLYFRSVSENTGKYNFNFANFNATSLKDGETKATATAANYKKAEAKISGLMDFNGDKVANSTDLYQAMTLITGEHASGKTYDVTVDLNKDGELTLEDLAIGYNYLVGNYELVDMLMLGLSADEAELMAKLMKEKPAYTCENEACEYGSKYAFDVCPVCRTIQPEEPVEAPVFECNNPTGCDFESDTAFKFCPKCRHEQNPMAHCANDHEFNPAFAYCPECGGQPVI